MNRPKTRGCGFEIKSRCFEESCDVSKKDAMLYLFNQRIVNDFERTLLQNHNIYLTLSIFDKL